MNVWVLNAILIEAMALVRGLSHLRLFRTDKRQPVGVGSAGAEFPPVSFRRHTEERTLGSGALRNAMGNVQETGEDVHSFHLLKKGAG